ncbi:MAG: PhzF family phenazine biosynthesis protein [Steroidobacteraceae bacterium]
MTSAAMRWRYATADVFTDRMFGGNPLAVVLDAVGLSTAQMQAIALEFNYSESTFVLPPEDPAHTARIRIFTPRTEVPFAGHPNVGTAFVLARESRFAAAAAAGAFVFEEAAGLVPMKLLHERGCAVGAELRAPEPLSRRSILSREAAAACLSLDERDIAMQAHPPQIVSVGLPFVVAELHSREALRRSKPNIAVHSQLLPLDGADAIFAYWRAGDETSSGQTVLHARMYSPLDGIVEDPATGSACGAAIALLASLDLPATSEENGRAERAWRIHQGEDMGRPSLLLGRTMAHGASLTETHVGGRCVPMFEGTLAV